MDHRRRGCLHATQARTARHDPVQFQVLDRTPIDVERYERDAAALGSKPDPAPYFTGASSAPDADEEAWKDTVGVPPGMVTRIIARFGPFTGRYVWHCHILEHEEHDMMRPFEVVP
jgi:spore coat protein A, manganese oxidase